jgi:hypothetical protein
MEWLLQNKEWLFSGLLVVVPLTIIGWLFKKRFMTKVQKQRGGKGSTNIQVDGPLSIIHGTTISEVREIAIDIFRVNFYSLKNDAEKVALKRAEEITESFLQELQEQNKESFRQANDPDFQYSLYTVQKEYARTGDKELGDLLVDLLVDRTKHENRSILQIVLNESIAVAPKLTNDQLAALSITFIFKHTIYHGIDSLDSLNNYLDIYIQPFISLLNKREACYEHLAYSGCGSIEIGSIDISNVFLQHYAGLFSKGFEKDLIQQSKIGLTEYAPIFIPCLHDQTKIQINALNEDVLKSETERMGISLEDTNKLLDLSKKFLMKSDEVKDYLKKVRPYMDNLFDVWDNSLMKNLTLTSVEIAIGHANVKKNLGEFTDLSIWIN